jgi:transposase InsO family protein
MKRMGIEAVYPRPKTSKPAPGHKIYPYLWAHTDLVELEQALEKWFAAYNLWKPHRSLEMLTPWHVYRPQHPEPWKMAA